MKRAFATSIILVLLVTALASTLFINLAFAYPTVSIELQSPENNKAYDAHLVQLVFTYSITENGHEKIGDDHPIFACYLDGSSFYFSPEFDGSSYVFDLPGFSDGYHALSIGITDVTLRAVGYSQVANFAVVMAYPKIFSLSIEQLKVYNTSALPFDFTISQPVVWAGYSLDKGVNVTVDTYPLRDFTSKGHTMLMGLSEGWHNIRIYARNLVRRETVSHVVNFKIENLETPVEPELSPTNPEPSETLFPATQIAVLIMALAAVISFGLVAYLLRRKKKMSQT
jgi:hypothetical protein